MTPRKFKVGISRFPYAGTGSSQSEIPEVGDFLVRLRLALEKDDRCENQLWNFKRADTPITMVRNLACKTALADGVDVLVMVDSDIAPDLEIGTDPDAKPFWDTAFDFFCEHYDRGPCVIAAPCVGPPPHPVTGGISVPYVFTWASKSNDPGKRGYSLELFSREEAAIRSGIQKVPAVATGLILLDMRLFETIKPPWFEYKYKDPPFNTQKGCTEDVFFTRNCSLLKIPVYVAWDCWLGHAKASMEGRPRLVYNDEVEELYRDAVLRGVDSDERLIQVNPAEVDIGEPIAQAEEKPEVELDKGDFAAKIPAAVASDGTVSLCFQSSLADHLKLELLIREEVRRRPADAGIFTVVEIGSWVGESALAICRGFDEDGVLYCVDTWAGSPGDGTGRFAKECTPEIVFKIFEQNMGERLCKANKGIVFPLTGRSTDIAAREEHIYADAIFIDGDHTYEAVKADIEAWLPHLKPGGLMCGHDYNYPEFWGVTKAVNEVLGKVESAGRMWWKRIEKPAMDVPVEVVAREIGPDIGKLDDQAIPVSSSN